MYRTSASVTLVILITVSLVYFYTNDRSFINQYGKLSLQFTYSHFTTPEIKDNRTLPKPILIMTYMRSGSTFLGDVIQSSPEVFYIFEPLWSLEIIQAPLKDLQGNRISGTFEEMARQITKDVFTCQIDKLPTTLLFHDAFMGVSRSTATMNRCRTNHSDISNCVEILQKRCLSSKFVMIKSIRLKAYDLLDIKEDFPNLKVIYLLRDPRAVLASQIKYGIPTSRHLKEYDFVNIFCKNVTQDTQVIRVFKKFYPGDVFIIYHDSFEENPLLVSGELYRALGIPFSLTAQNHIITLTGGGSNCTRMYALCTREYNSTVEIEKWRTEVQYSFVQIVDSLCKNVYKSHGFVPFIKPEMLKNMSYPSHDVNSATLKHIHLHFHKD